MVGGKNCQRANRSTGTADNLTFSKAKCYILLIYYIDSEHNLGADLMAVSQTIEGGLNGRDT